MRIAITIAQKADGKWECISLPGTSIDDQKKAYKKEIVANSGKYKQIRLMVSKASDKRHTFRNPPKVAVAAKKPVGKKK